MESEGTTCPSCSADVADAGSSCPSCGADLPSGQAKDDSMDDEDEE